VAQGEGFEFKPQYCKTKQNKTDYVSLWWVPKEEGSVNNFVCLCMCVCVCVCILACTCGLNPGPCICKYSTTDLYRLSLVFWDRVLLCRLKLASISLCSPGWPWTHKTSASASWVLGSQVHTILPNLVLD
jgi:hypothetical protein